MSPSSYLATAVLASASMLGCATMHSVNAPVHGTTRIDLGPITDSHGIDIAPMVASRINELQLAKARLVIVRDAAVPYVTGRVTVDREEADNEKSPWGLYLWFFVVPTVAYIAEPAGDMKATVDADLTRQTGPTPGVSFKVKDAMHLWYDNTSKAGTEVFDGLARGIAANVR
jgi:hypothetical protein